MLLRYAWMEDQLNASKLFKEVVLRDMPDPVHAREVRSIAHRRTIY